MKAPQKDLDIYNNYFREQLFGGYFYFTDMDAACGAALAPLYPLIPKNKEGQFPEKFLYFGKYEDGENLIEQLRHFFFLYRTICISQNLQRYPDPDIPDFYPDLFFKAEKIDEWSREIVLRFLHLIDAIDELSLMPERPDDSAILEYAQMLDDGYQMEFLATFVELRFALEGYIISLEKLDSSEPEDKVKYLELYFKYLKKLKILPENWEYPSSAPLPEKKENPEINQMIDNKGSDGSNYLESTPGIDYKEKKQIRVFISSTFSDMQAERDELVKTFNLLKKEAERKGISVEMVDLRWGITEEESARGEVIDICLKEINKSKPFFVGILGDNYGSVPPLELLKDNELTLIYPWLPKDIEARLSYTEIEMQSAVLRNPQNINAFFFLKDSNNGISQKPEDEKLSKLKNDIVTQNRYPFYNYKNPSQISQQIINDFRKIIEEISPEEENVGYRRLLQLKHKRRLDMLGDFYIPRKDIEQKINEFIDNPQKSVLVIEGEPGTGKSGTATKIINDFQDKLPVDYYFAGLGGKSPKLLEVAAYLLKENVSFDKIKDYIEARIDHAENKGILVIDDADTIGYLNLEYTLWNWLENLTPGKKIIFLARPGWGLANKLKHTDFIEYLTLPTLTGEEKSDFIEKYLARRGKKLSTSQKEKLLRSPLLNSPAYLRGALDELSAFGYFEELDLRIEQISFIKAETSLYLPIFEKLENSYGKSTVAEICRLIYISADGLEESDLKELTGLRQLDISLILGNGEAIFHNRDNIVGFANNEVRKLAYERYISSFSEEEFSRIKLINWLYTKCDGFILSFAEYDSFRRDFSISEQSRYIYELAFQLYSLQDITALGEYIQNLYYFEVIFRTNRTLLNSIWDLLAKSNYDFMKVDEKLKAEEYDAYLLPVILNDLICVSKDHNNTDLAIKCSETAFNALSRFEGKYIDMTRSGILNNAAIAAANSKNYEKALELFQRSKAMSLDLFAHDSEEVAKAYNNLGLIHQKMQDYEKSLANYQEALEIYNKIYGSENNLESVGLQYEIADCYFNLEKDDESIELYKKVAALYFKLQGENSPRGWLSKILIGRTYLYAHQFSKAIEYLNVISEETLQRFGKGHYVPKNSFRFLGMAWEETAKLLKDKISAEEYKKMIEYTAYAFSYSDRQEKAMTYLNLLNSL